MPHLLNSTLMANTRTIAAILENFATPSGVVVPEPLRSFMPRKYQHIIPFMEPPSSSSSSSDSAVDQWSVQEDGTWRCDAVKEDGGDDSDGHLDQQQPDANADAAGADGEQGRTAPGGGGSRAGSQSRRQRDATAKASYPLRIKCIHPRGVQFRTAPQLEALYKGRKGAKGARSGTCVPARLVDVGGGEADGTGMRWFATQMVPRPGNCDNGGDDDDDDDDDDDECHRSIFQVHPYVGTRGGGGDGGGGDVELWLPAHGPHGTPNFSVVLPGQGEEEEEEEQEQEQDVGSSATDADTSAADVDFEHDPATDVATTTTKTAVTTATAGAATNAKQPRDDGRAGGTPGNDNPASWGLGVLYEERRMDGDDAFTRQQFIDFYGGTTEWDAAAAENEARE